MVLFNNLINLEVQFQSPIEYITWSIKILLSDKDIVGKVCGLDSRLTWLESEEREREMKGIKGRKWV